MEYNNPSEIVKDLTFGEHARDRIMQGVEKLSKAVASTLGASGKCVIYEDSMGNPIITKDGVTVAESVILINPVENLGATLIKEAAKKNSQRSGRRHHHRNRPRALSAPGNEPSARIYRERNQRRYKHCPGKNIKTARQE